MSTDGIYEINTTMYVKNEPSLGITCQYKTSYKGILASWIITGETLNPDTRIARELMQPTEYYLVMQNGSTFADNLSYPHSDNNEWYSSLFESKELAVAYANKWFDPTSEYIDKHLPQAVELGKLYDCNIDDSDNVTISIHFVTI